MIEIFEMKSEIFILILSIFCLTIQIILCYKIKNKFIKLIPIILLLTLTIIFSIMIFIFDGWDSVGFLLLAICSGFLVFICGIGWLIWWIIKK